VQYTKLPLDVSVILATTTSNDSLVWGTC